VAAGVNAQRHLLPRFNDWLAGFLTSVEFRRLLGHSGDEFTASSAVDLPAACAGGTTAIKVKWLDPAQMVE
jgi:hypothetical protein